MQGSYSSPKSCEICACKALSQGDGDCASGVFKVFNFLEQALGQASLEGGATVAFN